jgi:hypothetical protein
VLDFSLANHRDDIVLGIFSGKNWEELDGK